MYQCYVHSMFPPPQVVKTYLAIAGVMFSDHHSSQLKCFYEVSEEIPLVKESEEKKLGE